MKVVSNFTLPTSNIAEAVTHSLKADKIDKLFSDAVFLCMS